MVDLLRYNFERSGYIVDVIGSGDRAAAHLEERVPDLLVLDWMLPGLSGIELCSRLRKRRATLHLPIIMLSARSHEEDKACGFENGADDYVVKPFSVQELLARVAALLCRKQRCPAMDALKVGDIALDSGAMEVRR